MNTIERNYRNKDVDMLMASSTLIENAISNKDFLLTKRSSWADPFFGNLKTRNENVIQKHLGVDGAKELRQSTQVLLGIQKQALKHLGDVKLQIQEDFKKDPPRRTEILKQLGFTTHLKDAQNKDQEALISLLYMFKENLTAGLRAEIEEKGTDKATLNAIVGYADALKNANVTQETFKSSKKTITAEAIADFNSIYDDVITVCKIAARLYSDKPYLKDQFSYAKVVKALNNKPGKGDDDSDKPQT